MRGAKRLGPEWRWQRGFLLNPYRFGGGSPPPGDPYRSNVVSHLHFDKDFTDQIGKIWTPSGSPSISTSIFRFGGGAGSFGSSRYIQTDASVDWAFGTGDFTVEAWVYATSMPTGLYFAPLGSWMSSTGWCFFLRPSGVLAWHAGPNIPAVSAASAFAINGWRHIAYTRETLPGPTATGRLFIDGVLVASGVDATDYTWTQGPRVGGNRTTSDWWRGYVDEMRITKGVARYTAAFTPPSAPFLDY